MRQADYVAGVTKTYRKYIDSIVDESCSGKLREPDGEVICRGEHCEPDITRDEQYLLNLYNKGGFTNYYDKHNGIDMLQLYER